MSPQFKMQAAQRLPLIISTSGHVGNHVSHAVLSSLFSGTTSTNPNSVQQPRETRSQMRKKKRTPRRIWRCTRQPKTFDHPGAGSPTKQKTKGCKANKLAGLIYIYFSPCSRFNFVNLVLGLVEYRKSMKTETNKLLTANRTSEKKKKRRKL